MSCPTAERLAAAASGEDAEAAEHGETCVVCGELLAAERAIRAALAAAPRRSWSSSRRDEVLASTLAIAERPTTRRWRPRMIGALGVAALAAAALLIVRGRGERAAVPMRNAMTAVAPAMVATSAVPHEPAQVEASPAAQLVRRASGTREPERIELFEGALAVDATGPRRPVTIAAGTTTIEVRQARVAITSRDGAIATVQVFAGSVEVQAGARRARIEVGEVWRAEDDAVATVDVPVAVDEPVVAPPVAVVRREPRRAAPTVAPERDAVIEDAPIEDAPIEEPAAHDDGFAAFRAGWVALRAGDARAARSAFDRVDEPEVAEDAAYWGAVAAERMGERRDALLRYGDFLYWFPRSPRVEAAQAAVKRLSVD